MHGPIGANLRRKELRNGLSHLFLESFSSYGDPHILPAPEVGVGWIAHKPNVPVIPIIQSV